MPFGRVYKWCPESVAVECDCGERLIVKASAVVSSFKALCHCGADPTADIQEGCQSHQLEVSGQMLEDYEATHHPWRNDTQAQADQHLRNEAAYPKDSPWRYNEE